MKPKYETYYGCGTLALGVTIAALLIWGIRIAFKL